MTEGVLCANDAELIGATCLEGIALSDAARLWGVSYEAIKGRRAGRNGRV